VNDRVAELKQELTAATEQADRDAATAHTRAAYTAERRGVLARIARLRTYPADMRFVVRVDFHATDLPDGVIGAIGPSIADLIAAAEADLLTIDATLEALEAGDGI
jgi:hypothetical protein